MSELHRNGVTQGMKSKDNEIMRILLSFAIVAVTSMIVYLVVGPFWAFFIAAVIGACVLRAAFEGDRQ